MKKGLHRCLSLALALAMLMPFFSFLEVFASGTETVLYSEDFSRFDGYREGTVLTQADGFGSVIPSTTAVQKSNENTFLQIDFASGYEAPDEKVWYLPDTYALVEEGTEGALCTDRASFGLISGNDTNIDKNLTLKNSAVSYTDHPRVVLEVKYYLSEDAHGSAVYFQLLKHVTEGASKGFLTLFYVDPATGILTAANGTRIKGAQAMEKGVWNTVSYVLDLVSGTGECYLNYTLHSTGVDLGIRALEIPADSLIVGKVHRTRNTSHVASKELAGYFCVDGVRLYSPTEASFLTVSEQNGQGHALSCVELTRGDETLYTYYRERSFLCTDGITVSPHYFDISPYAGLLSTLRHEVRTDEHGGIRFISALDTEKYVALQESCERGEISSLSFGTLIAPAAYVREAGDFTVDALDTLAHHVNYITVPATFDAWYDTQAPEGMQAFAGTLSAIHPSHYEDVFMGIGYVHFSLPSGEDVYLYADRTTAGLSIGETAELFLGMGVALPAETVEFFENYRIRHLKNAGGEVDEMSFAADHLFFRLHGDVYLSLSYTGGGGWRLRAQNGGHLGFGGVGAAQALSVYMNEEPNETVLPIRFEYSADGETLYLTAEDGSYLSLSLGSDFSLGVFSPTGREVACLSDITADGERVMMYGKLEEGEGIFGGGERFDSINRRGMMTRLYTTDGWNSATATYLAVPLFLSSRGGGLFFNRYEDMIADFGATVHDRWALELKNDHMDCYLFATDDMNDVIKGYTALSGYADLPEEWSFGVMLCRYAQDLSRFETDNMGYYYDNAPSGRSVKTLITSMMEAGMKPSSVIMEAWSYGDISADTESARANREELQKTIDWLDSHGIRTLLYMRVGGSFNSKMKGFDESYFLHAYITENGVTKYTNKIVDITDGGLLENPDMAPDKGGHWYLDFTNPAAVEWFYDGIWGQLIEMGVDGVKIDFCEEFPDEEYLYGGNMTVEYDWYDPSVIPAGGEHHSYPSFFMSSFYKRMNELKLEYGYTDGFYVLSRGGGIGSQKNPYIWAGDQCRVFSRLDFHLMGTVSAGLSGVPFVTYDMAGYRYDKKNQPYEDTAENLAYESEVFARAIEYTAFTVIIQTHGTVRNAYEMTEEVQEIYRLYCDIHTQLTDYIAKYVEIACSTGIPAVRHPVLEYQNDANVYNINDQFLLGDGLMVAPILTEQTFERTVYLPKGSWTNLLTGEVLTGGAAYTVAASLGQVPLFLNNESEDAEMLCTIFQSDTWQKIVNWDTTK